MLFTEMRGIQILSLLLLCATSLFSQTFSVTGKVVDKDLNPLSFVTVLIYADETAAPLMGTTTDDEGSFTFDGLEGENYKINFSFVGYESLNRNISVTSNQNIANVILNETIEALDETVVSIKKPTIVREQGKLVFNVEHTSLSSGNALELLTKTPGVLVIQDEISIKNSPTIVFINNKRVYLSASEVASLLKNVDASVIKSVEVITNPSAKYDAEAGAILNIITTRAISVGYKGSVNGSYEQAVYPKYNIGMSHFYKNDKMNFYLGYGFSPRKEFKDQYDDIRFFNSDGSTKSIWDTDFTRTTESFAHQGNIISDFILSEKSTLSFSSNFLVSPNKRFNNTVYAELLNAQQQLDSTFRTTSELEDDQYNLSFGGDFKTVLDTKGSYFSSTINYIFYDDEQLQDVSTNFFLPGGELLNNSSFFTNALQKSNIFTGALDISLQRSEGQWEAGIKYSNIDTKSGLDYFDTESGTMEFNSELSDKFLYEESIYAAYLNYSRKWGKWELGIGLRSEFTSVNGNSRSLGEVNTQEYFELFPSASLHHQINDKHSLGLSYARHIERPRYQSLNPFKYFLNESNYNGGNPNLVPSMDDKITLSYNYKSKFFIDLYYHQTENALSLLRFQDNENMIMRTVDSNLIKDFQYSLDMVYVSSLTPWWYLSLYTSGFYFENEFYAVESIDEKYSNSTVGFYGQFYSGLTFSKDQTMTGDVTAVYLSDFIYGSYDYGNQFSLSISVKKSFWNKTGSVTLGVNDLFDTYNVPVTSRYYNQDNSYFAQPESRLYRVSFKYTFGNTKLRDNNRDRKPEETTRLEKN